MNVGIVCDLNYKSNNCFSNYYYAIKNLFKNVTVINSAQDLDNIDLVFIGNEHYGPHLGIWNNDAFINRCNDNNIKVCIYTAEYIQCKLFPWNIDIQRNLERFKHLYQRMIDVGDALMYNKKVGRNLCSFYYKDPVPVPETKINKCAFIGAMYPHRAELISKLEKNIEIDVLPSSANSWIEYMNILASYRFVLSPYSNDSDFFALKFYEILLAGSIPVHQVRDTTLDYYTEEATFKDAIYFKDAEELPDKINGCSLYHSYNRPWLEDELTNFFTEHGISTEKFIINA